MVVVYRLGHVFCVVEFAASKKDENNMVTSREWIEERKNKRATATVIVLVKKRVPYKLEALSVSVRHWH